MSSRLEDVRTWRGFDGDVREEVVGLIELCRNSSEMDDEGHPKHEQFSKAVDVAVRILNW